jgi:hypothetical protein
MAMRAAILVLAVLAGAAHAQPGKAPADALREGNDAAQAGDWSTVGQLMDPLLRAQLPPADLAEAHRLAGLAAYYQGRRLDAETQFVAYLRIDIDGQLDPALYAPDVITFFTGIKAKYSAELRARRPKGKKRYWIVAPLPVASQIQNGDTTKAIVIGSALGVFLAANVTSAIVLSRWCRRVSGEGGSSMTCDEGGDHYGSAPTWRTINAVGGVGAILSAAYGVYDGVKNYRRLSREASTQPFVSSTARGDALFGIAGSF